jgi:hypothetical protein
MVGGKLNLNKLHLYPISLFLNVNCEINYQLKFSGCHPGDHMTLIFEPCLIVLLQQLASLKIWQGCWGSVTSFKLNWKSFKTEICSLVVYG